MVVVVVASVVAVATVGRETEGVGLLSTNSTVLCATCAAQSSNAELLVAWPFTVNDND